MMLSSHLFLGLPFGLLVDGIHLNSFLAVLVSRKDRISTSKFNRSKLILSILVPNSIFFYYASMWYSPSISKQQ
jgi:hypothetical protein